MTARCEPPLEYQSERYHWLRCGACDPFPARWVETPYGKAWNFNGSQWLRPGYMEKQGYRYIAPCPIPKETDDAGR